MNTVDVDHGWTLVDSTNTRSVDNPVGTVPAVPATLPVAMLVQNHNTTSIPIMQMAVT